MGGRHTHPKMGNWFSCFSGRKPKHTLKTSNGDECNGDGDFRIPVERGHPHERRGKYPIPCRDFGKNPGINTINLFFFVFAYPETDELLSTSPLHIASGNDLYNHSLLSSNMTAAGSSATKKTTVILNGGGNAFHEMTTTTGNYKLISKSKTIPICFDSIVNAVRLIHLIYFIFS